MPISSLRRSTVLLVLTLGLALALPGLAAAAPHREPARQVAAASRSEPSLAGWLWSFLTSVWDETGCYIDPDGLAASPAPGATGQTDTGCHIDPNGCRAAQPATATAPVDEGCYIDPNGCRLR